jgi:hypothetical protein
LNPTLAVSNVICWERPVLAQSGRSYANGISWSDEKKIIQFPTGKEIAKPCQSAQARAGRSPKGIRGILDME